ncbi:hypothetical protein ACIBU0_35675 [Streptomyces sp. NPDC049627]|uniref:hypothetical protein n=1 Tax=Streptomyces sp. NPDC049627 TaxID=3365595 RepID=UPI0037946E77
MSLSKQELFGRIRGTADSSSCRSGRYRKSAASTGIWRRVLALGLIGIAFLGIGQVFGTATALAILRVPQAAGTGSALLGTLQSILGGVASPLVGLGGEDTAVPLFAGMTGCSLIAVLALLLTRGGTHLPHPPRPAAPVTRWKPR